MASNARHPGGRQTRKWCRDVLCLFLYVWWRVHISRKGENAPRVEANANCVRKIVITYYRTEQSEKLHLWWNVGGPGPRTSAPGRTETVQHNTAFLSIIQQKVTAASSSRRSYFHNYNPYICRSLKQIERLDSTFTYFLQAILEAGQ